MIENDYSKREERKYKNMVARMNYENRDNWGTEGFCDFEYEKLAGSMPVPISYLRRDNFGRPINNKQTRE